MAVPAPEVSVVVDEDPVAVLNREFDYDEAKHIEDLNAEFGWDDDGSR